MRRPTRLGSAVAVVGFLLAAACGSRPGEEQAIGKKAPESEEHDVATLQSLMEEGRLTAKELTQGYLDRIAAIDDSGPGLNAILEVNPGALEIAEALDEERRTKGPRGPLHGIPVILKGNIDTGDRMTTTAGSLALEGHRPGRDAFLVERLRDAGAVILGKANLSEWANFRSTRSSSGWSSQGGQTRNPYALDRNPCGSSSGSAVAVAANLTALAVGTETDGSIVCPAGANGIVGIKPTLGLVSRSGIIPIAHSQDTAGPMARSVRDATVLFQAMVATDPSDPASGDAPPGIPDYLASLGDGDLTGIRIGVMRDYYGHDASEEVKALYGKAIDALTAAGAGIIDPADLGDRSGMNDAEFEVLLYEFKADLTAYLVDRGSPNGIGSLEDLIAWNAGHRDSVMPFFGQEIFTRAQEKGTLDDAAYKEALAKSKRLSRGAIDAAIAKHDLDAIIAPTNGPAWKTDLVNGDHFSLASSSPAAIAGYPNVTVPMGDVLGLPVGLSFFGAAYSEPTLIRIAHAYEQATRLRKSPQFLQDR